MTNRGGMYTIWFYLDSVPITQDVLAGRASLGGSESACLELAKGLVRRGHDVHVFATRLEAEGRVDGVIWHAAEQSLVDVLRFASPDVFCALRLFAPFHHLTVPAKLNLLWNQDLLVQDGGVIGALSQVDRVVFVSEFHKKQWCDQHPLLEPMAWVTRNAFDERLVPDLRRVPKQTHRFIHISRPERALDPLLAIWPKLKAALPDAELAICRYQSMYDGEGSNVAAMCQEYDRKTAAVADQVGGIVGLGTLNKTQLYREIAQSELMLYPGIPTFAETACLAAVEAQACGTPLIASWKGALPETLHPDAGVLLSGDAYTAEYHDAFVQTVLDVTSDRLRYERMRQAGIAWAPRYAADVLAKEWDDAITGFFEQRYEQNKLGVIRQLLHWDHHAAARVAAQDIIDAHEQWQNFNDDVPPGYRSTDYDEAKAALALCDDVIAQRAQTADHYALYSMDPRVEADTNQRLMRVRDQIVAAHPSTVLDMACGNGALALMVARALPDVRIVGVDYSEGVLAKARAAAAADGLSDRLTFEQGSYQTLTGTYDVVFCGEFLEHVEQPWELIDRLEQHCAPGGQVILTTPCGPFAELLEPGIPRQRGHVHAFSLRDIADLFEAKQQFRFEFLLIGESPRGTPCGYWLLHFTPGGGPAPALDYSHTILTTRPYQRLAVSMIVKNGADWLRKCLHSVERVADKIVIYDTGSTDESVALARAIGATVIEGEWPHSFGEARNRALAAVEDRAEWVLWIDADEQLIYPQRLRRYLTGAGPFHAYVIRQNHLMLDVPNFHDKPCRVFRTGKGIRFYGDVHEQPEDAPDTGIVPALELPDVDIVHLGYHEDGVRRQKLLERNLNLLKHELHSGSPRELAYVLALRDYVNLAQFRLERSQGRATQAARDYLHKAVAIWQDRFRDPTHRYHDIAYPFYETALKMLNRGVEVKWAFAAASPTLKGTPKPETFRALDADEVETVIRFRMNRYFAELRGPDVQVDPIVSRNGNGGWGVPPVHAEDAADERVSA